MSYADELDDLFSVFEDDAEPKRTRHPSSSNSGQKLAKRSKYDEVDSVVNLCEDVEGNSKENLRSTSSHSRIEDVINVEDEEGGGGGGRGRQVEEVDEDEDEDDEATPPPPPHEASYPLHKESTPRDFPPVSSLQPPPQALMPGLHPHPLSLPENPPKKPDSVEFYRFAHTKTSSPPKLEEAANDSQVEDGGFIHPEKHLRIHAEKHEESIFPTSHEGVSVHTPITEDGGSESAAFDDGFQASEAKISCVKNEESVEEAGNSQKLSNTSLKGGEAVEYAGESFKASSAIHHEDVRKETGRNLHTHSASVLHEEEKIIDPASVKDEGKAEVDGEDDAKQPLTDNSSVRNFLPDLTDEKSADLLADVVAEVYESDKNCVFKCIRPLSHTHTPVESLTDRQPAKEYPFKLDPFQMRSIQCLERGESVLVSAHTSAGKTVVAEYAVAMALRDRQRVIYTSPIKALSNQKYRDLSEEFQDVGLLTGDVTLNPRATVMVMTTEILRSMLYRGSEVVREMKWVIFDEIHYMRDRERGVVWEETIILLPDTVRLVFLSATIPNALEFAEWICRVKHQPCNVIYTDYRPTPLHHFVFPAGGDQIVTVMDETKTFLASNFQQCVESLGKNVVDSATMQKQKRQKTSDRNMSDVEKIARLCQGRQYLPVIFFAFSKKACEAYALALKNVDMTDSHEKAMIEEIYNNAVATLAEEDAQLPQVKMMLLLLRRGIGIHHGGLLPLLKETIEIIFQESLIKVLFSTETFSIGINMPAKTVVFTSIKKWDGVEFRFINSGEYIQMAGRAGRRGLDDRGISIIMLDEKVEPEEAKKIFLGEALRLESQFHLGYNMLLNLLRVEGADPEYIIKRSFRQFQNNKVTLAIEEKKTSLEAQLQKVSLSLSRAISRFEKDSKVAYEALIAEYYETRHDLERLGIEVRAITMNHKYVAPFLTPGRLVELQDGENVSWGWGICFGSARTKMRPNHTKFSQSESVYVVDCFVCCLKSSIRRLNEAGAATKPMPGIGAAHTDVSWEVVPFNIKCLKNISSVKAKLLPGLDISTDDGRTALAHQLSKLIEYFKGEENLPLIDPIEDMHISDPKLVEALKLITSKEEKIAKSKISKNENLQTYLNMYNEKMKLKTQIRECEDELQKPLHLVIKDDLRAMRRVLKKLEYIDNSGVVTLKGRIACEISAGDELLAAELLFHNLFDKLGVDYILAILSCLVFDEKCSDPDPTDEKLLAGFEEVKNVARRISQVSLECKLAINPEEYVDKFKISMMKLVVMWVRGAKFSELLQDVSIFEGSIIRCLRRLEELLRQMASACKNIGNEALEKKLVEGMVQLKRGIVFASSLYL